MYSRTYQLQIICPSKGTKLRWCFDYNNSIMKNSPTRTQHLQITLNMMEHHQLQLQQSSISLIPRGHNGGTTNNPTCLSAIHTYSNQNSAMHMGYTINTPAVPYPINPPYTPITSINTNTATTTYTSSIGPPSPRHHPHQTAPSWQGPPNFATTHHHIAKRDIVF